MLFWSGAVATSQEVRLSEQSDSSGEIHPSIICYITKVWSWWQQVHYCPSLRQRFPVPPERPKMFPGQMSYVVSAHFQYKGVEALF